jgi:uncharacterized membrane protein
MNRPFANKDAGALTGDERAGDERAANKMPRSAIAFFLWAAIALGALLRLIWAGKQEFWYDEVLSMLFASGQKSAYKLPQNVPFKVQDISQLLSPLSGKGISGNIDAIEGVVRGSLSEPHPPMFYLSEHIWMRLFGNSESASRALVLLLSLVTIGVAYFVGRRILGPRGGLIFTALLALNPFFLAHSLNMRMYGPMLLWVMVSGGCLLALVEEEDGQLDRENLDRKNQRKRLLLRGGVAIGITAGLMTLYLFAYWIFALVALALYLDRKHWFQHAVTIGAGILMFMPWVLWGIRQQLNNRREVLLDQFSSARGPLGAAVQHGKDLAQTVANHLLLGHLTTGMLPMDEPIKPTAVAIGCGVIGFVALCVVGLYRRRQYRVLMIAALMGLFPLLVALAIDVVADKYVLGFGWGRSTIVAVPGCLLLVAAWLELATGRWRGPLTALLLAVYVGVNVGDFGGRDRQMFHQVNAQLANPDGPALVVMNSRAWGHVLRLAYYLDEAKDTEILATNPADVTESLEAALAKKDYSRVLWLNAEYPLWELPKSPIEAKAFVAETEALLQARYPVSAPTGVPQTQLLRGTMNLDRFALQVYPGFDYAQPSN